MTFAIGWRQSANEKQALSPLHWPKCHPSLPWVPPVEENPDGLKISEETPYRPLGNTVVKNGGQIKLCKAAWKIRHVHLPKTAGLAREITASSALCVGVADRFFAGAAGENGTRDDVCHAP